MDHKKLDAHRRQVGELENDLIDAYASNRINRRDFVRRGTILGLSAPFIGGVVAACGGDDDDAASGSSSESESASASESGSAPATAGGDLIAAIQFGDANSGLDPLNMLDLGTYSVLSQSFEYLVGLGSDGNIAPTGLATSWEANADGTAWTFNLREGVTWQDGTPFTSADVAATIDRMAVAGAGVAGVISEGAVETPDELTAVVNLDGANGNLPVLVSLFNPQSLVTPADYSSGTTLNERPAGTGAWMLDNFDASTFEARFVPNPNWWGGSVNLDSVTLQGFDNPGTAVAAASAREVDLIQFFSVVDGASLLNDSDFVVKTPPSANHRQLWFNLQPAGDSAFTDARVRQAVGYCLDRQQMVDTLFEGQAVVANDHPIFPTLPFFDPDATPQRPRDIEMARQLLSDAGVTEVNDVLQVGDPGEIPDLAAIVANNCAEAGINLEVNVTPNSDFYGAQWCPAGDGVAPGRPCGDTSNIGIVDYGHRPTPDIYLTRALQTDGDWNSSNYADADYDALVTQYQSAVDVDGQKAAIGQIQQKLHADGPALYPFFFNYLGGHDASVSGVEMTALGHINLQNASKA